ncbi:transglutaminase-like domain-containing protein [Alkaliphilus hydrothermalis]|uniref:Transglutaminase-like putative cysteine protease n=1 Tax=Alkaliphilus hydrothermalis TaxID=1482730 RepID=A0ABS2NS15_9FIRM|nr:transglutaminase-like domain-containing protein [Alkaliphilus hydrothermalis]MBM7615754.1 transglutaminase-like putative cysteine protease [Alkaliphilus hydrothermalis]
MFRRMITGLMVIVIVLTTMGVSFGQEIELLDTLQLQKGIIRVKYTAKEDSQIKVMVQKGENKYVYGLTDTVTLPLQFGNGDYTISILVNVEDNKYKMVKREKISLNLKDSNDVFLNSIDRIEWNTEMKAIQKAKQLTQNLKSDEEKVKAIYQYIVENFKYDDKKINKITSDYLPNIEAVYGASSGLCYDYAALFAAMLRSVGVPTKLMMGYKNDIKSYHAWNSVYIKEKDQWFTIDTTYDSISRNKGTIYRASSDYKIVKYY